MNEVVNTLALIKGSKDSSLLKNNPIRQSKSNKRESKLK